jgi:hypothetical protein
MKLVTSNQQLGTSYLLFANSYSLIPATEGRV